MGGQIIGAILSIFHRNEVHVIEFVNTFENRLASQARPALVISNEPGSNAK
jgi:hypothetical protein